MYGNSSKAALLGLAIEDLRPARASYGRLVLRAPWGIELPFEDGVRFHLVAEGECVLFAPGSDPVRLGAGDVAFLPKGAAHAIADGRGTARVALDTLARRKIGEATYRLNVGTVGDASLLICCTIGFDTPAARRLLEQMPGVMVVRAEAGDATIGALVRVMADEAQRERMGMATLLPRIADIVVTWTVRAWAEAQSGGVPGWLATLGAPGVGAALVAIDREPERRWSLEELARLAGMSRAGFAARFKAALGQSPGRYVRESRMTRAAERLGDDGASMAVVAAEVGYGSQAAFARAFKGIRGVSPGRIRKRSSSRS